MSSAVNHRKRSHRSEYRARPFNPGARESVITPTLHKNHFAQFIRQIRQAMRGREGKDAVRKADADAV